MLDLPIVWIAASAAVLVLTAGFVWWINSPLVIPRTHDPKRKAFYDELYQKLGEQDAQRKDAQLKDAA